jgi:hypothetical protein
MDYKKKYLKYKKKYIDLKNFELNQLKINQKAGMGYYKKYWNEHHEFTTINENNKKKVLLDNSYNENNTQFNNYSKMLDNMLKKSDDNLAINLDFINNFYREIYYDVDNTFKLEYIVDENKKIKPVEGKLILTNDNYLIDEGFTQTHGNTSILFLKHKSTNKKYVMKIYNNINIDINKLKDYLSLQIIHITTESNNWIPQNNYIPIPPKIFDIINFNKQKNFISTQNEKIYLACRNNDAINDYINNLIIQQINKEKNYNLNFVKYHNLLVIQVNGNYRYCVIMDQVDGDISKYFNTELNRQDNTYKLNMINGIFNKFETDLNKLKTPEYLFTHTDMKCENVFYKKNEEGEIIPLIADLDKSSISYHNIRFYNDITTQPEIIKRVSDPTTTLGQYLIDNYTILQSKEYKTNEINNENIIKYRLSRVFRDFINRWFNPTTNIQTEQVYMRYNYTPYYMSFDMCSLILSVFNLTIFKDITFNELSTHNFNNFIIKYLVKEEIGNLFIIYREGKYVNGDFGELLHQIIYRPLDEQKNIFINKLFDTDYLFINQLYLTKLNKIGLTIPFSPNILVADKNSTTFSINNEKTINFYNKKITNKVLNSDSINYILGIINKLKTTDISANLLKDLKIDYTGDYSVYGSALSSFPDNVIKTNKYSNRCVGISMDFSCIYEYDNIDTKNILETSIYIYESHNGTSKNGIYYPRNRDIDEPEQISYVESVKDALFEAMFDSAQSAQPAQPAETTSVYFDANENANENEN